MTVLASINGPNCLIGISGILKGTIVFESSSCVAPRDSGGRVPLGSEVVVTSEGDSFRYLESGQPSTALDVVAAINKRAAARNAAPWVLVFGVLVELIVFKAPFLAITSILVVGAVAWILNIECQQRRQTLVRYHLDQAQQSVFAALQEGLTALSRASAVWRVEPDSATLVSGRVVAHAGTPQTASIKASMPIPGIEAGPETFHFFPDQLIIRTRRRYTPITYADLKIEARTVDVAETGSTPADSTIVDRKWKHARRDGGPDRRYGANSATPIVRYALVILVAGPSRVGLMVSSIRDAEAFASAIQTVAQRFTAKQVTARSRLRPVPITTAPVGQPERPGTRPVFVPDVVGMRQAAAATLITGAGLVLDAATFQPSGTVATGNVISQSPAAGTSVNVQPGVSLAAYLVVSSGPAKKVTRSDAATALRAPTAVAPALGKHPAATEPVRVECGETAARGFALPPPRTTARAPGVQLDAALIEAKRKEMAVVSALLARVFDEDAAPTPAPAPEAGHGCIPGLDVEGSAFARLLATKPAWSRGELESVANERAILLDGTIEAINNAAFACCDACAMEGDDPIEVNISVLTTLAQRTVSS